MSFQVYTPKQFITRDPLAEGECAINKRGDLTARAEDLKLVAIDAVATVLFDELGFRVAVRKPLPADGAKVLTVRAIKNKHGKLTPYKQIHVAGAIKAMRLDPPAVAGRYTLTTKQDLLIVHLQDAEGGEKTREVDE